MSQFLTELNTSMTLVTCFCHMSSVRSTSDGRGPVTRKRVPDREEPGKPRKDARRGRCHLLEAGFCPLWMTLLPRPYSHKSQVTSLSACQYLLLSPKSVPGPCLHAGCARTACVSGGSRGNCMGAGGWCLAPRVGGVRWSGPARNTPRI